MKKRNFELSLRVANIALGGGMSTFIGHQLLGVCVREFCSGSVWAVATVWEANERSISFSMRAMGVKALAAWA